MTIRPFLVLMRPANIVTAIADILAGLSISSLLLPWFNSHGFLLIVSTVGLYGGGIVFNDIFDAELDSVERPERPIPSGKVSLNQAKTLGISLLLLGCIAAFFVTTISGCIAVLISILALVYDKYSKHHPFMGPLNMGLCRSFNLLLGISIANTVLFAYWPIAIVPLLFIFDITLTSRGEVSGNNTPTLYIALGLDFIVGGLLLMVFLMRDTLPSGIPFLILWLAINIVAKWKAIKENTPKRIQNAVKMGVLSLIPLNASIAAGFEGWLSGLLVLSLLPVSILLAKSFSVT